MFKLIKFGVNFYGVAFEGKLFTGTKTQAGNFALDRCNADVYELCEVMRAFEKEGKNYADFGVNGGWAFIDTRDTLSMLPSDIKGAA